MKRLSDIKFSTLDLVPVRENGNAAQSLRNPDLAQHVENSATTAFGSPNTTTWMASPVRQLPCCSAIWRGDLDHSCRLGWRDAS